MATYSTNEFKSGLKVMLEGDPCTILENEFVKPGKGQAFNRVKLRNLKTNRVWEKTFKSGDSLEGGGCHRPRSCSTCTATASSSTSWSRRTSSSTRRAAPPSATPRAGFGSRTTASSRCTTARRSPSRRPTSSNSRSSDTEPGIRGDTATGGSKPARLSTGATVKVPLFVNQGEIVKCDTRSGEYVSRVKS
jgi:elongation factor P